MTDQVNQPMEKRQMDEFQHEALDELLSEVLDDPDTWRHHERLIALLGEPTVEELVSEAKQVLAIVGEYTGCADDKDRVRLFRERVLRDPDRAKRLAEASDVLDYEAMIQAEEEDAEYARLEEEAAEADVDEVMRFATTPEEAAYYLFHRALDTGRKDDKELPE